jgi:hypothetical protein
MDEHAVKAEITCPVCGHVRTETIPNDKCVFFYECSGCGAILRPKPGDCCVFCSFADQGCMFAQRSELNQ